MQIVLLVIMVLGINMLRQDDLFLNYESYALHTFPNMKLKERISYLMWRNSQVLISYSSLQSPPLPKEIKKDKAN